jgi:hypothetical protein
VSAQNPYGIAVSAIMNVHHSSFSFDGLHLLLHFDSGAVKEMKSTNFGDCVWGLTAALHGDRRIVGKKSVKKDKKCPGKRKEIQGTKGKYIL